MHRSALFRLLIAWIATPCAISHAAADAPPLGDFAAVPAISDVSISPDGHYLAMIGAIHDRNIVTVRDRTHPDTPPRVVMIDPPENEFHVRWCRWAMPTRLVCGFRASISNAGRVFNASRLAAVDADGSNLKVLVQNSSAGVGQVQDQILDWHGGRPDTVLIQSTEDLLSAGARTGNVAVLGRTTSGGYPAIFELNVVTGAIRLRQHSRNPIVYYISDRRGEPRLALGCCGNSGKTFSFYVRAPDGRTWGKLLQYDAFSRATILRPLAIDAENPNRAYAFGPNEGRNALWSIDLTDKEPPSLVFDHPLVDIEGLALAKDGTLLGVRYDTDTPHLFYLDSRSEALATQLRRALGDAYVTIADSTEDKSVYVVSTASDIDAGTYYLLTAATGTLQRIGTAYPRLDAARLGRLRTISYPARDGTVIPGYLMTPSGVRPEHLPLIVMPHGGPIARDTWRFDFLQQFLVSRGYAVLQMNFRGSSGYGDDWFYAAHQDWGGLTYSDIVDGAKWAVSSGIADPAHLCILGWSFGGYAALLGATRDGELFKCSVSIAGVSDLTLLLDERWTLGGYAISREQIGSNSAKLAADSPRKHADAVRIPLLMIHGTRDAQAPFAQSDEMATALKHAGKPFEFVVIPEADHQMSRESDRLTMLGAIENFLRTNLGPGITEERPP